ncbi:hypothetical protein RPALISO_175 [Ruegeria phage RpAliso]|nr:hypothetical protein RPALISO_175 [Ruegeria phage RpAliso]
MARGQISRSPGKGKKIATFPFDVEQEADGKIITRKVEIEAYMQSKYAETSEPPKMVTATQFYLTCEGAEEFGTDLNACLQAMRGKLDLKYKIKWERWLLVRVSPSRIHGGIGAGVELSWSEIERGVTLDGDVLMREYNVYGDWNNKWKISPWPEVYKDRNGKTVACVAATDENERALGQFAKKLRELTKTLSEFVAPDNIEDTLRAITNGGLNLLTKD